MNIISMKNGSNRKKFQEIRWDMEKKKREDHPFMRIKTGMLLSAELFS